MKRYRVLMQGECVLPSKGWRGFWVVREVAAEQPKAAEDLAITSVNDGWDAHNHGPVSALAVVTSWQVGILSRFSRHPDAGHVFYNDDADAQREALDIELMVANAPRHIRRDLRKLP